MTTANFAEATRHLELARGAIDGLELLHRERDVDKRLIAAHYDEIGQNMQLARVEALLHIGRQLDRLVDVLDVGRMPGIHGRPLSPAALAEEAS